MTNRFSAQRFIERIGALSGELGREVIVLDEVDSTSSELRRRLKKGARPDTVVVAHRQLRGRGRVGRVWHSSIEGNLCFSTALRIGGPTDETVPLLPLAAGLAAREAAAETGAEVFLKWPNDLLIQNRKVAGILCETVTLKKKEALAVVGLGVNIADVSFSEDIARTAISLNKVIEKEADISFLAARFTVCLERLNRLISEGARREIPDAWRKAAEPFGRRVQVGDITGKTVDLAPDGRLIVQDDAGNNILIAGGIVESLG